MTHGQVENLKGAVTGSSDGSFCPECGKPFALSHAGPTRGKAFTWRSIFLAALGFYLTFNFGLTAWHQSQTIRDAAACPNPVDGKHCSAAPSDDPLTVASRNIATGEAFTAGFAEVELVRDERYAGVGLAGLAIGLGAIVLRPRRGGTPHRSRGDDLFLAAEGVLVVIYGQLILLAAYQLVKEIPGGAALSLGQVGDSVYRALGALFALVGVV